MIRKSALLIALGAMVPLGLTPVSAQQQMIPADGPLISLTISESVESAPDIALIGTGVQTQAMSAKDAMRDNAARVDRMISALRRAGVDRKDIQTSGINLHPRYDHSNRNGEQPRFLGYAVSNQLNVTVRDISEAGTMIDALVEAGASNINGPNFSVSDSEKLQQKAREKAVRSATERAEFYAKATGYSRARLVSISESGSYRQPRPMMMARSMDMAEGASTQVEPGQVSTNVSISVQFVLER